MLFKYINLVHNLKTTPNKIKNGVVSPRAPCLIKNLINLIHNFRLTDHHPRTAYWALFLFIIYTNQVRTLNFYSIVKKHEHIIHPKILASLNKLSRQVISLRTKSRRLRSKLVRLNSYWRKVKNHLKFFKPSRTINATNQQPTWLLQLNIDFKKINRVYLIRRKKDNLQLFKQKSLWIQNNSKFNNEASYTTASTLKWLTHNNQLLILNYKNTSIHNRRGKHQKTLSLFKKTFKRQSQHQVAWSALLNARRLGIQTHTKATKPATHKIPALADAILCSQPPKIFDYVLVHLPKPQPHKINSFGFKSSILHGAFSFYDNSISVNNLLTRRASSFNALLKIQISPPISGKNMLFSKTLNINWLYFNSINISILSKSIQIHSITNYYPLFYFCFNNKQFKQTQQELIFHLYYMHISAPTSSRYKNFYIFFLVNFLEKMLQKKLWVRADARDFFSPKWHKIIEKTTNINLYMYRRFNRIIPIKELIEIIILMFSTRDLQIFLLFMKGCFEKSHFKKHKKILSILFDILRKNKKILQYAGIKGFFFDIRGKVGVSGNAKKRHVSFSLEKITNTSQNVKSYWQQIDVWTPTGQMGITCYITF